MTYSDEFKKAWEEYPPGQWHFEDFKAGWDACEAVLKIQQVSRFFCFVDGTDDPYPDCVIGTDRVDDCTLAKKLTSPKQCKYWREVK